MYHSYELLGNLIDHPFPKKEDEQFIEFLLILFVAITPCCYKVPYLTNNHRMIKDVQ